MIISLLIFPAIVVLLWGIVILVQFAKFMIEPNPTAANNDVDTDKR